MPDVNHQLAFARWRLVLGRFADPQLPFGGGAGRGYARMDRVLEYLYGREYAKRGVRKQGSGSASDEADGREGGSGASILYLPDWLREVRELFPRDTIETMEKHALERYGMTEL